MASRGAWNFQRETSSDTWYIARIGRPQRSRRNRDSTSNCFFILFSFLIFIWKSIISYYLQADVEVIFEVQSLENAEPFNSSWSDPQELCELKPANATGEIGPFGILVLTSKSLEEQTAVFFRIFKDHNKHVVLMCQDPTRYYRHRSLLSQSPDMILCC